MRSKIIVINADDLGRSPEINDAIVKSFQQKIVSDASVMTTCKKGFEDLVYRKKKGQLTQLKGIGCHLCLTLGEPLCRESLSLKYVNNNKFKDIFDIHRSFFLRKEEREIIYNEFKTQVTVLREALELPISHLDSHQHIHFGLDLLPLVVKLCKEEAIPFLRIPSYNKELSKKSKIATKLKILYIRAHGIKTVDIFGSPQQVISSISDNTNTMEIMVHPMYNSKGEIVNKVRICDVDHCKNMREQVNVFENFTKSSYSQLIESVYE